MLTDYVNWIFWIGLDLSTKLPDKYVDNIGRFPVLAGPDIVQDPLEEADPAGPAEPAAVAKAGYRMPLTGLQA